MITPFQKTLYRPENGTWHYLRLLWQEASQSFEVRTAPCGLPATPIRQEPLLPGETKETALHRLVVDLRQAGYLERPTIDDYLDVQIFTPDWDGFAAAAPWFDALQSEVSYPLYQVLQDTANGGNSGGVQTAPGCITHYLWVLNPDAATAAVETIARQAPSLFRVVANSRKKAATPAPTALSEITEAATPDLKILTDQLTGVMAGIVEEFQQTIKPYLADQPASDKTYPDQVCVSFEHSEPDRVHGEQANLLRERLLAQWGVGKGHWPPLGDAARCETLHVEGLDDETAAQLTDVIQKRIIGQVYALDAGEGVFMAGPERLFSRFMIDDTYWFDDGLEWIVYVSHHDTATFGGEWLLDAVGELFKDRPERLNPWF
ncbi:MAG: hypothetical protein IPL27_21450 [Lewinellaceae bacterium]|nr:hypothetical protein [Lewinellaceae bacterium]